MSKPSSKHMALVALLLVGLAYGTMIESFSWNQTSHYALIRQLDNDTAQIDPYQVTTGDKAFYKGHWYSARAPGLALYSLPFYNVLVQIGAPQWTLHHQALRNQDDMIWLVTLWGAVLPGLILVLLVWRMGDYFEKGFGVFAALALGLGTLVLPLSTLLFSHVFTACLGFAAFTILLRERDGPKPRIWMLGVAGLIIGYSIASEYPLFFTGAVLGLYALSRRDRLTPAGVITRALTMLAGIAIGVIPLLLYNHLAFGSYWHIAYADVPRQKAGFFGIGTPRLSVLATLLFDSRGMLTLSPVLALGAFGTYLLYRRGRRAEAIAITAICALYLLYNSGYYLPFGGGAPGPRFLTTMLPFLAMPLALAVKRLPGPCIALAGVSITTMVIATATHPLVGYETETVTWMRFLGVGFFQPTIATAYGAGRGWGAISPFFILIVAALGLGGAAMSRVKLDVRGVVWGLLALFAWLLFAHFGPTGLGIDRAGLANILHAGDSTALKKPWGGHPLDHLAEVATVVGLMLLGLAAALRNSAWPSQPGQAQPAAPERRAALSTTA
jgi:hypothetical protein